MDRTHTHIHTRVHTYTHVYTHTPSKISPFLSTL